MNHIGTREIATERLTLRRFEIEDAENVFYNWFSDEQTVKYLTWPVYKSVDEAEDQSLICAPLRRLSHTLRLCVRPSSISEHLTVN